MARIASQHSAIDSTASASRSSFTRCSWEPEIRAGPEDMSVSERKGRVEEGGGTGDLAAEGVPDEVHGHPDRVRLCEHVPRQLALRVGCFVVFGAVRLVLAAAVHGDGAVAARGERFVQQREVLLAAGVSGQQQRDPFAAPEAVAGTSTTANSPRAVRSRAEGEEGEERVTG
ncbi:hypothetical protein SHKM778_14750 [Streptomyces sp. KM77-8]|uniref:Uncharacterized protein n=1 Tax=Streptomyces haneummycinicus TaxID=3074435 RepID=A0AAT9HD06_9ACTN